jgi:mono/diheme cytochrome c family protein
MVYARARDGAGEGQEEFLSKVSQFAPWILAIWTALQVTPADAQGNIDAGKSPAQIFGDTCSACHRSPRELRRTSASFLRTHYAAGTEDAAAMANYLASLGNDPPAGAAQPRRPPSDVGKQNPRQPPADQGKSAPGQAKGRPATTAQVRPAPAPEEKPPDPPAAPEPELEPFEE